MTPTRKRKTLHPCGGCGLHQVRCICATIPTLVTRTRLSLLIHHRELKRTTNTGTLAARALTNSSVFVRGRPGETLDVGAVLPPDYQSVILFPGEGSISIADLAPAKPINLIVPDGNWRQAAKVHRRHPEFANLIRVRLAEANEASAHLRREHFAEGFATLAAIAKAFAALEDPAVGRALSELFERKLAATLAGRPRPRSTDASFAFR